ELLERAARPHQLVRVEAEEEPRRRERALNLGEDPREPWPIDEKREEYASDVQAAPQPARAHGSVLALGSLVDDFPFDAAALAVDLSDRFAVEEREIEVQARRPVGDVAVGDVDRGHADALPGEGEAD